jgi:lipopolysaccharide cholinephosphotransferase
MGSMQDSLKNIQEINRKILKKLTAVCKEYDIRYFLDAGALLGAVRHHSFIPWDDDVDVAFRRKDFEKLLRLPEEVWGEDFELVTCREISGNHAFLDFGTRLIYLKEKVSINTYEKAAQYCNPKYRNHMALDIFVLDTAYASRLKQKILQIKLTGIYGLAMGHRGQIRPEEYRGISGLAVRALAGIGKRCALERLWEAYERLSRSVPEKETKLFYSNYPVLYLGVTCDKKWYEKSAQVSIDGELFDAPAEYDRVLTALYGDYMKLPPEEERRPQHLYED